MKRLLSLILTLVLIVGTLSACGNNANQYFVDDYNDFMSQNQSSEVVNTDDTVSDKNESSVSSNLSSTNSDSSDNSSTDENSSNTAQNNSHYTPSENNTQSPPPTSQTKPSSITASQLPIFSYGSGTKNKYIEDDRYITRATQTTAKHYNTYINSLLEIGFSQYAENKIGDNLFATLINDSTIVSMSYMKQDATTMVIAEPKTYLYPRKQDNKYQSKGLASFLTGIKGETVVASEGMGFVIRLDDGSFIIIDGGMGDPNSVDSYKLLDILKEQSPKGTKKPVIAAWIFTHPHGDHIGVFNTFSIDFHDQVVIEAFYCNFPTEQAIKNRDNFMFDNSIYRYKQFQKAMKEYYPNVPKIRSYTGDKYYIRNAVIEILFSYENLFPTDFNKNNWNSVNTGSLIFKIDIAGQSIMITGDVEDFGMKFATRNYGSYLKSDILQMAHHGLNSNVDFYSTVNPSYALLPVSFEYEKWEHLLRNVQYAGNLWLVNSPNVRQIIEFSKSNVTIPLPYNPKNSDIVAKIPTKTSSYKIYSIK